MAKIVIVIEEGIVQDIFSDVEGIEFFKIDRDVEGADMKNDPWACEIPYDGGLSMLAQDPDRSNRIWHTLNHGEGKTKVREVT